MRMGIYPKYKRDDASSFHLDTMTTCKQYAAPTVQGCDANTTRTDYVNKHPSVLQTTSYNFAGTCTTAEAYVGVKAQPLHVFLKGSKKKKEELKREDPENFAEFDRICDWIWENPPYGIF